MRRKIINNNNKNSPAVCWSWHRTWRAGEVGFGVQGGGRPEHCFVMDPKSLPQLGDGEINPKKPRQQRDAGAQRYPKHPRGPRALAPRRGQRAAYLGAVAARGGCGQEVDKAPLVRWLIAIGGGVPGRRRGRLPRGRGFLGCVCVGGDTRHRCREVEAVPLWGPSLPAARSFVLPGLPVGILWWLALRLSCPALARSSALPCSPSASTKFAAFQRASHCAPPGHSAGHGQAGSGQEGTVPRPQLCLLERSRGRRCSQSPHHGPSSKANNDEWERWKAGAGESTANGMVWGTSVGAKSPL